MALESGSLSTPEFAKFSKSVVPYLHVTTHIEGHKGEELSKTYGIRGFPTLKFLDAEGHELAVQGGRDVAAFQATHTALASYADLKRRIDGGEKGLAAQLLMAELALGKIAYPEAKERLAKIKKIKPELKAKLDAAMLNAEVDHMVESIGRDQAKMKEVGAKFAKMAAEGRVPTGDSAMMFWNMILGYAEEAGDAALYKKAYDFFNERFGDNDRYKPALDRLKETYEKLSNEKIG